MSDENEVNYDTNQQQNRDRLDNTNNENTHASSSIKSDEILDFSQDFFPSIIMVRLKLKLLILTNIQIYL